MHENIDTILNTPYDVAVRLYNHGLTRHINDSSRLHVISTAVNILLGYDWFSICNLPCNEMVNLLQLLSGTCERRSIRVCLQATSVANRTHMVRHILFMFSHESVYKILSPDVRKTLMTSGTFAEKIKSNTQPHDTFYGVYLYAYAAWLAGAPWVTFNSTVRETMFSLWLLWIGKCTTLIKRKGTHYPKIVHPPDDALDFSAIMLFGGPRQIGWTVYLNHVPELDMELVRSGEITSHDITRAMLFMHSKYLYNPNVGKDMMAYLFSIICLRFGKVYSSFGSPTLFFCLNCRKPSMPVKGCGVHVSSCMIVGTTPVCCSSSCDMYPMTKVTVPAKVPLYTSMVEYKHMIDPYNPPLQYFTLVKCYMCECVFIYQCGDFICNDCAVESSRDPMCEFADRSATSVSHNDPRYVNSRAYTTVVVHTDTGTKRIHVCTNHYFTFHNVEQLEYNSLKRHCCIVTDNISLHRRFITHERQQHARHKDFT